MTLRSENVTRGAERAPNRSLFYAMGYTKEELERPLIGVVSAHSEIVPGHYHLDKLAEAVKAATGSTAKIEWDATKPDGTPRKLCDTALIRSLGWKPEIDLKQGLEMTVASYRAEVAAGTVRLGGR